VLFRCFLPLPRETNFSLHNVPAPDCSRCLMWQSKRAKLCDQQLYYGTAGGTSASPDRESLLAFVTRLKLFNQSTPFSFYLNWFQCSLFSLFPVHLIEQSIVGSQLHHRG